jgi:hypothetical protein
MSLIAFLGDAHIGARQGSIVFQKNFKDFCDYVFFPTLKKRKINHAIQFGDLFDVRKQTHSQSLHNSKICFFDPIVENDIDFITIVSNHDMFFRETLEINTPELVLGEYVGDKFRIYTEPTTVNVCGISFDLIPWICDDNQERVLKFIENSNSKYCIAHLELNGFQMSKGHFCEHGLDRELFKKYEQVYSGHFHTQSKDGNIHYIGTPCQLTREDEGEIKGFHIFDTETRQLEFIPNPYNLFEKIVYDNGANPVNVKGKFVRVIVENATDRKALDKYIEDLWAELPEDVKVIENMIMESALEVDMTLEQLESEGMDTVTFVTDYTVNSVADISEYQKTLIQDTFKTLYEQSKEVL